MQPVLHGLALALVMVVGYCTLVLQPFPVLHDYPEWMYQGWVAHHLLFGDATAVSPFALSHYPVPNSITHFAIAVLNNFLSPIAAGKTWLACYLLYASVLWTLLARRLHSGCDGAVNLLLMVTITFGPGFWNGYANFQFALLLWGTYLLLMQLRRDGPWVHLLLSLLIFFAHAAVFIAFAGLVTARVLLGRLSWRQLVMLMPTIVLFLWYLAATVKVDEIGALNALGLMEWVQYKVYSVAKQGYFHNFILSDGSSLLDSAHGLYLAGVGVNLAVVLVLGMWLLHQVWQFVRAGALTGRSSAYRALDARAFALTLFTLLLLFLLAGKDNFGVVNLGERFLIAALVLAMVCFNYPVPLRRVWTALAAVGAAYTMAAILVVSNLPVEPYAVVRSTTSSTLDGAIGDIYANSRHKLFNHRIYIYADHGIWLQQPGPDFLPLKHITSFVVPQPK